MKSVGREGWCNINKWLTKDVKAHIPFSSIDSCPSVFSWICPFLSSGGRGFSESHEILRFPFFYAPSSCPFRWVFSLFSSLT
jgi:hypothetical protein